MRYFIIEDEIPSQRRLMKMIESLKPDWECIGAEESIEGTIEFLKEQDKEPDLIFADIQLTDGVCFDIFTAVEVNCPVIFTTAYDEFAIQAFKVNSVDYLLKPIKEERLVRSFAKLEKLYVQPAETSDRDEIYRSIQEAIQNGKKEFRKRFLIQFRDDFFALPVDDIAYIYSVNKISFARTFEGKEHVLDFPLEKIESQLDPDSFFRANRQIIIHRKSIIKARAYFNGRLKLVVSPEFDEDLIVSREKSKLLKDWLSS